MRFRDWRLSRFGAVLALAVSISVPSAAAADADIPTEAPRGHGATTSEEARLWTMVRAGLPMPEESVGSRRMVAATLKNAEKVDAARGRPAASRKAAWDGSGVVVTDAKGSFARLPNGRLHPVPDRSVAVEPQTLGFGRMAPALVITGDGEFNGPNRTNSNFLGGSCGNSWRTNDWGRVGLCWWKYRSNDSTTTRDYWPYLGAAVGEPAAIPWSPDPYVRYLASGSQMTSTSRSTVGYRLFVDHAKRTGISTGDCIQTNVSLSYNGAGVSVSGLEFCDTWESSTDGSVSWKRMMFNTGFLATGGKDYEVGHGSLSETNQRPYSSYAPTWNDTWWATFCRGNHSNCK